MLEPPEEPEPLGAEAEPELFPRASGVLLHLTSLPSRFGIGDMGDAAYRFVEFLASARQQYWQIMPLGPTSYGDSPYQALSALAGNPLLINLEHLVDDRWLAPWDLDTAPHFPENRVDYGPVKGPEQAVLRLINEQVLTSEFVDLLVSKVNENLERDTPDGLEAKVGEKQQKIAEVQESIGNLLDLAERSGAVSAAARLVEREAELKRLLTELQELELRREAGRLETYPEQVQSVLNQMRDSLMGESIDDQRTMLAKVLVGMEMGTTYASLTLSLPLSEVTGIYKMPPRDLERTPCRHPCGAENTAEQQ